MGNAHSMMLVRAGRWISADGQYVIQRYLKPGKGRYSRVMVKRWAVGHWNEQARDFLPVSGADFATLNAARDYVASRMERPF